MKWSPISNRDICKYVGIYAISRSTSSESRLLSMSDYIRVPSVRPRIAGMKTQDGHWAP